MSAVAYDKELEQYRNLMLPPDSFQEGFRWSSLFGAIFIALLMVPGAMYMGLVAGQGIGPAAQWVTVILFLEVARRAHQRVSRPELFVLFYMASAAVATPFSGLLWNQFYVQSPQAHGAGVAELLPLWYAPRDPQVLDQRNFFMVEWLPAIGLVTFGTFIPRLNGAIMGYGLFRLASDVEKLPFPLAPIGAQGITALAEQEEEKGQGSWRWRVFAIGGVIGLAFGALYIGLPTISGAMLTRPIVIFPIPWSDFTRKTQDFLPATAMGINWDLGNLIVGMVMPFFAVVGSFVAMLGCLVANPILYRHTNVLHSWAANDETVPTIFKNSIDFYFSFSIGVMIAIALMGFWQVYRFFRRRRQARQAEPAPGSEPATRRALDRGDIKLPVVLGTYFLTTMAYILLSGWLIDWHRGVMIVLVFFGFIYTPLINYVASRLVGLVGQAVEIPFVREAAFILSGYTGGVKVWFLPVPVENYSGRVLFYRQAELTGTKFWSVWKTELILVPIVLVSSIFFANFIWSLAPIPSARYPFAENMWELRAATDTIVQTSTLGRFGEFQRALNGNFIAWGAGVGGVLFFVMSLVNLPMMFMYGVVGGLSQSMPHALVPQFIGALIGRYYFQRRLGLKWLQYVPVVAAGFSCGVGLITVLCVGVTFLAKAVIQLPY
jgi:hypothetical protein